VSLDSVISFHSDAGTVIFGGWGPLGGHLNRFGLPFLIFKRLGINRGDG